MLEVHERFPSLAETGELSVSTRFVLFLLEEKWQPAAELLEKFQARYSACTRPEMIYSGIFRLY